MLSQQVFKDREGSILKTGIQQVWDPTKDLGWHGGNEWFKRLTMEHRNCP